LTYRVIQIATGEVGKESLLSILRRDDLELVGVYVYSPEKSGVDAGTLVGLDPVGIAATDDFDAILALEADCAVYCGRSDRYGSDAVAEVCAILASGKNVTTTAISTPINLDESVNERLTAACEEGQTSYLPVGINPGFLFDFWPVALSRVMRRIDRVDLTEVDDMSSYTSAITNEAMGFGLSPDADIRMFHRSGNPEDSSIVKSFRQCFHMLGKALGFQVVRFEVKSEVAVSDRHIEMATTAIEPGTVFAIRNYITAFDEDDIIRASLDAVWKAASDPLPPGWPDAEGPYDWKLHLVGDPPIQSSFQFADADSNSRADMVMVCAQAINGIPTIVAASPGIHSFLDLPMFGGKIGS
jgi:hypothetical protein